jgi:hypothetical protein
MQGPATLRPPLFMQVESSTLQCLGACLADTAAPRSLPEERRLVRFAMGRG